MKKGITLFLLLGLMFSVSACGNETQQNEVSSTIDRESHSAEHSESSEEQDVPESSENMEESISETDRRSSSAEFGNNILVAYFSLADNVLLDGDVDAVTTPSITVPGQVAQLAEWISEETGGDLFIIQVTEPYSPDEDEVLSRGNDEKAENARPELTANVENIADYDIVFLGYPNWWYSCPMAILSFIEENDLSGKQVFLFCSHGTGGLARSVEEITAALPDADISDNVFHVYQYDVPDALPDLQSWLQEIGY